jgi:hypothetical protein
VPKRLKELALGALIVVALIGMLFAAIGVLSLLRNVSCNRLDEARVAHLEPGHDTPGPDSIYVIGVGPGPPPSHIVPYLEAEAEMTRAGCSLPATVGSES